MRKALFVLIVFFSLVALGQQSQQFTQPASVPTAFTAVKLIGSGVAYHRINWYLSGTVSSCNVKLEQSQTGVSGWTDLITGLPCTTEGASTITGPSTPSYVRVNATTLSGGGTLRGSYVGFVAPPMTGGGGGSGDLTVGTSTITGGSTTRVLYDNAGVLGEYVVSGSGNVVMSATPTIVTPDITTGFTIGTAGTLKFVPRGNGTRFVPAQLACADLSDALSGCSSAAGSGSITVDPHANPASITPDAVSKNYQVVTGQAQTLTINNPTGCTQGLPIFFRIKDSGSPQTLTFGGQYNALNVPIPTTTVAGKTMYIAARCNTTDTTVDVLGVGVKDADTNFALTDVSNSFSGDQKFAATTGTYITDTDGATITFNLATSNLHTVALGGARTLAVSNGATGKVFTLVLCQDSMGSRTVTWFASIKWAGGSAPTLTATASKCDAVTFIEYSAGNFYGTVAGQNF